MKIVALFLLIAVTSLHAADPEKAEPPKPAIKVLADGFPSGHDSPEGVAADLARSFIKRDASLFESACIKAFGAGQSAEEYEAFLQRVGKNMRAEAAQSDPSPGGPKSIAKVYAARNLSMNGPVSTGNTLFGFRNIMFVDVLAALHNGGEASMRIMVIQTAEGKWFVHPAPLTTPLLSAGLNDEKPSEKLFGEAYTIVKP